MTLSIDRPGKGSRKGRLPRCGRALTPHPRAGNAVLHWLSSQRQEGFWLQSRASSASFCTYCQLKTVIMFPTSQFVALKRNVKRPLWPQTYIFPMTINIFDKRMLMIKRCRILILTQGFSIQMHIDKQTHKQQQKATLTSLAPIDRPRRLLCYQGVAWKMLVYQGAAWMIWCLLGLCLQHGVGVPGGCLDDMVFAGVVLALWRCGTRGLLGRCWCTRGLLG
jgi:hypothetical protein